MKKISTWLLGLSIGVGWDGAGAEEVRWRPIANSSSAVNSTTNTTSPAVTIHRPVPMTTSPQSRQSQRTGETAIRPASKPAFIVLTPIVRGQQGDDVKDKKSTKDTTDKTETLPFAPRPVSPQVSPSVGDFGCDRPLPELARNCRIVNVRRANDFCVEWPDECCPPRPWWGRFYFSAEYLLWWMRGAAYPPLVTTSPLGVPENDRGRLGPNTEILFGGRTIDHEAFSGGRGTLGFWMDPCKTWAIETTYFQTGERSINFAANSSTFPVLARPIQILNQNNIEGREIFATIPTLPGDILDLRGSIAIEAPTRLWGIEGNVRRNLVDNCRFRVDVLAGYRYVDLQEGLHIREDVLTLRDIPGVPIFANDRAVVTDNFDTRNRFNGGQIGTTLECRWRRWSLEGTFKLALGVNQQTIEVSDGMTIIRPNGTRSDFNGGLLALPSNIGRHTRDEFAVVPEVGVKLGFQLLPRVRAYVGYDFLYVSSVVRPADQVDRSLDIAQIPNFTNNPPPNTTGQVRPIVPFRTTDFWAQGVNFGLEFKY
jgi:hypothetical protein